MMTDGFFLYVCKECSKAHLVSFRELARFAEKRGNPVDRDISKMLEGYRIKIRCPKKSRKYKKRKEYLFEDFTFIIGERWDYIYYGQPHLREDLEIWKDK